jgi:hypothetical protein
MESPFRLRLRTLLCTSKWSLSWSHRHGDDEDSPGSARSNCLPGPYSLFVTQNSLPSGSAQTVQWKPAMS